MVLATLFFLYIKSPARFHSDVFSVGLVAVLWLVGGYMNTRCVPRRVFLKRVHCVAHSAGRVFLEMMRYNV